ncbi:MAG TPA: chromosome segregation protein SMC, partial [Chitinophagaceae bacterium]|nr:chromosome segregation protein SMC [Chitinophagaceae bacterium]
TLSSQQLQELDAILALETEIRKEGAELEAQKLALSKREEELHVLQKAFNEIVHELRNLENNKNLSSQKIQHLHELIDNITKSINEAETQSALLAKATEEAQNKLVTEEATLQTFKSKLEELRLDLDEKRKTYDQQKSDLDLLRNQHQQLQVQQFEAEKIVAIAENNINNQQRSIHQLEEENKNRQNEIQKQNELKDNLLQISETKSSELNEAVRKQEEATEKLLASQAALEELRVSLFEENRKQDSKQNEYNLLKSLVDSLEGYPDSIKYLSKNPQWKNDSQLLSELFNVQDEYRTCIEGYLDKYLNYYVTDTAEQAYQAIALLQTEKKGKAGFFILSEIDAKTPVAQKPASGISALEVIQCESKYQAILDYLLHNVYITEDLQIANPGKAVLLQKDGTGFKTGKRIVGGSVGVFEGNKIGRTQRLEKLKNDIDVLNQSAAALKLNISETQNLIVGFNQEVKNDQINKIREELNRAQNQVVQIEHRIENYLNQTEASAKRIDELSEQLEKTKQSIADTQKLHQDMKQQMTLAFDQLQQSQAKFSGAEAAYNKSNEEYNQHNIIIARQQSRINEINAERQIRQQQIEELSGKVTHSGNQLQETKQLLVSTEKQLKEIEEKLYAAMQNKEHSEKNLNEKDSSFYVFRNEINEREQVLNKKRRTKEQSETQLTAIKDKLTEMKLQLTSMKERLHVEFKIDLDEVLKQPRVGEESIELWNAEVDRLKKRIENLGEVNPMAVEAFREMKGRHDFIQEQKADLNNAKESLLKTIEEVEATANQKFKETFDRVKENFKNVFHALFTQDDMCDMKLVDPENLADTTIEIYAQPKGKKPSTITQLSGGEKTLTSAAFLFAIYLIKPAPFCVLDEVDAPLDDANVGKFTNMIRKFSDNSQFIIVTHNKQTMASVDVIYGVTMQEAGVSKLVPVDFRSLN